MKIKIEVEIDTKEDTQELSDLVELVTEFRDRLISLGDDDYDD
tara:strand:+ start:82 stop:210 length:129 start_codon:yes stop_codon:yes gene_type:complete